MKNTILKGPNDSLVSKSSIVGPMKPKIVTQTHLIISKYILKLSALTRTVIKPKNIISKINLKKKEKKGVLTNYNTCEKSETHFKGV